jgi:Xaa-Pro aminopeptidase
VTRDPLDGRPSREVALKQRLEELYGAKVRDVAPILSEMRRVKKAEEIAAMRRAAHAGALGMIEAMRSTRPGLGEWELEGLMSFVHLRQGAAGPAYHGIVGSGPNSLVLHYSASSRRLEAGESLLIDYGPEVDHYTTDITRTWPTDGRYSERMAELYDAVLAAQAAGIAAASPGRRIRDVERACSEVLRKRGLAGLVRHGSCHYIGMEVHDVGEREAELVPGVAFTIEPGVYEPQTGIGIRIEDVVVITAEGCEVITSEVPRERAAIEALIAEEGVLDWLDSERGR